MQSITKKRHFDLHFAAYQSWLILIIAWTLMMARAPDNIGSQQFQLILPNRGEISLGPSDPPKGHLEILVDVSNLTLTVFSNGQVYKKYPIAIGKWRSPTPTGEFTIIEKTYDPGGPFGSRWMGLNVPWGRYGIHGTNSPSSIGWAASAGCIRMYNKDVEELFEWAPVSTKVNIIGYEPEHSVNRTLALGDTGPDVQYVQYRLRQMGFDPGPLDGWFGNRLELSIKELQLFYGLYPTGQVTNSELRVLGVK